MKTRFTIILILLLMPAALARGTNGIISLSGLLRGAHFRVQYIIPLHGNFKNYERVEIVKLESALGDAVPTDKMERFANHLQRTFEKMGLFSEVQLVDSFSPPKQALRQNLKTAQVNLEEKRKGTLVITGKVIDYAKGNRLLRELGIGIAPAVFTVRFSMFDKESGQELARGNMSGVVQATWMSIPGISSNDVSFQEVETAVSDQVDRRSKAGLE